MLFTIGFSGFPPRGKDGKKSRFGPAAIRRYFFSSVRNNQYLMEFALSENNERILARPHTNGFCPVCNTPMIPRCGEVYANHWAHKSKTDCDPWWENETKWHRQWKETVHCDLREVVIEKDSIKHRADVQLPSGIVFEFQKSPLSLSERQARENFYEKLIWIIFFPRQNVLEMKHKKIFLSLFGGIYLLKIKGLSEGFSRPPHFCPIFLDFDDGEMFRITMFRDNNKTRVKWIHGRIVKKTEFIDIYLTKPFLSAINADRFYQRDRGSF